MTQKTYKTEGRKFDDAIVKILFGNLSIRFIVGNTPVFEGEVYRLQNTEVRRRAFYRLVGAELLGKAWKHIQQICVDFENNLQLNI